MNKKYNRIFIVILTALMIAGLMSSVVNAAYTGESDLGKSVMGQNYNNTRQFFATGTAGQAIPTAGLFPICGTDGTNTRAITVGLTGNLQVDILSLIGIEFSGTDGTTGPVKSASIAGTDSSGYIQEVAVDSDGNLQVDILAFPAANLGQVAKAASLSVCPATDITDTTYIGDIKFGEELPAGTQNIGDVDIASASYEGTHGAAGPAKGVSTGGTDAGGNFREFLTDASGRLNVTVESQPFSQTEGTAASQVKTVQNGLEDNSGNTQNLQGDSDKSLKAVKLTYAEALSAVANTTTTDETTMVAAPGAGSHIAPISIVLSAPAAGEFTIRNGVAGTIIGRYYVQATGQSAIMLGPEFLSHCSNNAAITISSTAQPYSWVIKYEVLTP